MLSDLTVLQAKVLALVGWADGRFDEAEQTIFRDVLEVSPGDDALKIELFELTEVAPNKDDVLQTVISAPREFAAAAIKNAFMLAKADGNVEAAELELLFELSRAAGVPEDRFADFCKMLEAHMTSVELERQLFGT